MSSIYSKSIKSRNSSNRGRNVKSNDGNKGRMSSNSWERNCLQNKRGRYFKKNCHKFYEGFPPLNSSDNK